MSPQNISAAATVTGAAADVYLVVVAAGVAVTATVGVTTATVTTKIMEVQLLQHGHVAPRCKQQGSMARPSKIMECNSDIISARDFTHSARSYLASSQKHWKQSTLTI